MKQNYSTTIQLPRTFSAGEVVAVDVSASQYMEQYAENFHEWVQGVVIKMSPVSAKHDDLTGYLRELLRAYFALHPIGIVRSAPFVMRLEEVGSRREPDLQIVLGDNQKNLQDTFMDGAADIAIEVVSYGSVKIDYGEKRQEFEQGGVQEYWIIDPLRKSCTFYRLTDEGYYHAMQNTEDKAYQTPLLPHFQLDTPTLWQETMPKLNEVWNAVQAMFPEDP
jgi:Uma2 family endonuclease